MTMAFIAALIMQDCGLTACPLFSSVKIFGFTQVIECCQYLGDVQVGYLPALLRELLTQPLIIYCWKKKDSAAISLSP